MTHSPVFRVLNTSMCVFHFCCRCFAKLSSSCVHSFSIRVVDIWHNNTTVITTAEWGSAKQIFFSVEKKNRVNVSLCTHYCRLGWLAVWQAGWFRWKAHHVEEVLAELDDTTWLHKKGLAGCYTKNPSETWAPLICARKVCTLFMIFFWCPTKVTPRATKSLSVREATWSMVVKPACRKWSM